MNRIVVLSAGGTGGHLFPAQALAGELVRRGKHIVVMTDSRFANYATAFPGAEIETVPSSPLNSPVAPFRLFAGAAMALAKLWRLKPAAVVGFGG
jgi:UDP-N-acetylglucosamine--N-acetylmuramyl-(pentapeptide) pyrophosphoryl-undecaprenol N-acetylglucosamine transferase